MLEVKELVKSFGTKKAVDQVSFSVTKGKILGVLGRNGAGKTTIFRTILNIIKPDSGEIYYEGKPIVEEITDRIGYLPEEGSLILTYTVLEQFLYYGSLKSMSQTKVKEAAFYWLEKLHILEYLNMKIKDLSKGNRQKIQFIVALLHDPDLLILDEPFSGLDPISVEEMKQIIIELKQAEKMIVFSSHRMDHVALLCEDILMIDEGNVLVYGNLENIKNSYGRHELVITGNIGKYTFDIIKNTLGVSDVLRENPETIRVKVASEEVIPKIFNLLKSSYVTNFYTETISLDDIFMDKVGSRYEEK